MFEAIFTALFSGAGIGLVIFGVIMFALIWAILSLRVVVPVNKVHAVQYRKTNVEYGRGKPAGNVYYAWPSWLPILGIAKAEVPTEIFKIDLFGYESYDVKRIPFLVDVTAFYRVSDPVMSAQRSSNHADLVEQLRQSLKGSIRSILAQYPLDQIMQDRSVFSERFTTEVGEQIKEFGVSTVQCIELMDISDVQGSDVIQNMMAKEKSKIEAEARTIVAQNKRDAAIAETQAQREADLALQEAQQQVGIRTAEREREVGIAAEQAHQQVLEQNKLTTERKLEIKRLSDTREADIAREVANTNAKKEQEVAIVQAEGYKTTAIINADADREAATREADAAMYAKKREAEGTLALGSAKAKAEEAMLMAPVNSQIALAKEIGENQGYQTFLLQQEQIVANRDVGTKMAEALVNADVRLIGGMGANGNDPQAGLSGIMDMFTPKGGSNLSSALAALAITDEGAKLVNRIVGGSKNSTEE